jgi:tRNA(adenine34) deaminase
MDRQTKESLIQLAMQEAQLAANEGNYPFGTILAAADGNVIGCAHNTQNTDQDPTAHAEINLIRGVARIHGTDIFSQSYLVSNAESCSMCMSAAIKAGILHYVFGTPSEPHMEPFLTVTDVAGYCRVELDITYGVLAEHCRQQIAEIRKKQGDLAQ